MSIVVVGLNHKTAPISLLERLAIPPERITKALHQLSTYEHVVEGAILSTCNRIEVYALLSRFHGGVQDVRNMLAEFCHVAPEEFVDRLYTYHDEGAVRHLFRVAAGIDSMVIGESEILGQVRKAMHVAAEEGILQRTLQRAFRQALRVGKRARTETAIGRNPVSVSSAAVELARRAFEDNTLRDKKVAIVGAGKMGRLAVRALGDAGVSEITVVNRSEERAEELAARFGVVPLPLERVEEALAGADIVISSTMAPGIVIEKDVVATAVAGRLPGRPLFIVDIAVPHDVAPEVAEIDGVVLRGIEDLRGVVEAGVGSRLKEVSRVEEIVSAEVDRFVEWERATEIAPTIASLITHAEDIRRGELEKVKTKLADLTARERAAVEEATRKMIAKLLHDPLTKTKELASSKRGHLYLAALRELFELDDDVP